MKQPLCLNTDDGPCPNFALNGTDECLQHAEPSRLGGEPILTGYVPGGIADEEHVEIVSFAGHIRPRTPAPASATDAARVASTSWTAPPPPVRRRGWFAALAAVFR